MKRCLLVLALTFGISTLAFAQPVPSAKPAAAPSSKPAAPPPITPAPKPAAPPPITPAPAAKPPTPGPSAKPAAAPPPPPSAAPEAPPKIEAPKAETQTPSPEGDREEGPDPANKPLAEEHFTKGLALLEQEAWTAALAEFLESRNLFPTRNATVNAAICLRKLERFDESLDLYEAVLREFPNMPQERKAAVRKEVTELRALVGTIDIASAEPGAGIVVDGKARQEFPLLDPLRVPAGTHSVRLFKEGFQPFETRVEVAGGQTVRIEAKMPALAASGRLKVQEKSGKPFDVLVDGAQVGVTPWEGSLAVGEHVVTLRGDGDLGTEPSLAVVKQNQVVSLTLQAVSLEASLAVKVDPTSARVLINNVAVGRGIWDGPLRAATHEITVEADGFFPKRQSVSLSRGDRKELAFSLERDESAEKWRKPSKIVVDVSGGVVLSPGFGGDTASLCGESCSGGIGLGGLALLHVGYEFGFGLGIGLAGGFLQAEQSLEGRDASLDPVGISPGLSGATNETLLMRGGLVGITGGYHLGETFTMRLRLGAGAFIGNVESTRTGSFVTRAGNDYDAPVTGVTRTSAFVYIDPEAMVGYRVAENVEILAGLQALVVIAPVAPTWGGDDTPEVVVEGDGLSRYPADETLVGTMVLLVPGVSVRADF